MKTLTFTIVIGFLAGAAIDAETNPRLIVMQSIENYETDWKAALNYTYTERNTTKDSEGEAKSTELSQVTVLDGTPFSRLIAKDGHPLTGDEARKEEEKYRKAVKARDSETPEQRAHRIRKYENERIFLREIPDAFNMKMLGRETINGRPNYVIALTPKPDYVPKSKYAHIFSDIEGKLWVDEQDVRWTKAEANVISDISIGWVLARIGPGAHIKMSQVRVNGQHWLPREIDVNGEARIMLVKKRNLDETVTYSDYKPIAKGTAAVTAKNP